MYRFASIRRAVVWSVAWRNLVVANHRSIVDIPLLLSLTGGHMLSRGHDEAAWFGEIADLAGTIYVNQNDPASGANASV